MQLSKLALVAVFILYSLTGTSQGDTIYVDSQADCPGDGSQSNPYCILSTAIRAAASGDVIIVKNGFYSESLVINQQITITASDGPVIVGRWPQGTIVDKWISLGGGHGPLGSPTSEERNASDGSGARIQDFEHGTIRLQTIPAPLTFFQHNMALIGGPWFTYNGTERDQVPSSLIDHLRREAPDIGGLSEVFYDDERDEIRRGLGDVYPFTVDAPEEQGTHEDGGLLLLSKHPILESHTTIYRPCHGIDCEADKGAIHARIRVEAQGDYDIFLTHLQADGSSEAWETIKAQHSDLYRFIQAHRDPKRPALLMGDLNTVGAISNQYDELISRLNHPEDLWLTTGDGTAGYTSGDPVNTESFEDGVSHSINDPNRHRSGLRLDYFLSWRGSQFWPTFQNTHLQILQSSPGRDISDHYGLKTEQIDLKSFTVDIRRRIDVTLALNELRCLTLTTGSGPGEPHASRGNDHPELQLSYTSANGAINMLNTGELGAIDMGESQIYEDRFTMRIEDPGAWLEVRVQGWEVDVNEDDYMGESVIRLERIELLELIGRSATYGMPYLTGHDGEWGVTVRITVEESSKAVRK